MSDAEFERAADNPMRLIFSMRVRSVPGSGRIRPLKDAVAFTLQTLPELPRVRLALFAPSFDFDAHALLYLGDRAGVARFD